MTDPASDRQVPASLIPCLLGLSAKRVEFRFSCRSDDPRFTVEEKRKLISLRSSSS